MRKIHIPTKITPRYRVVDGASCPGCGRPMKTNEKIMWCADAPGYCSEKNKTYSLKVEKTARQ